MDEGEGDGNEASRSAPPIAISADAFAAALAQMQDAPAIDLPQSGGGPAAMEGTDNDAIDAPAVGGSGGAAEEVADMEGAEEGAGEGGATAAEEVADMEDEEEGAGDTSAAFEIADDAFEDIDEDSDEPSPDAGGGAAAPRSETLGTAASSEAADGEGSAAGGGDTMVTDAMEAITAAEGESTAEAEAKALEAKKAETARKQEQMAAMIKTYYQQMTSGCANPKCANMLCFSNQNSLLCRTALAQQTRNDAAALSIKLAGTAEKYTCEKTSGVNATRAAEQIPECICAVLPKLVQTQLTEIIAEQARARLCTPPNGATAVSAETVRAECARCRDTRDRASLIKFVGQWFSDSDWLNFSFLKAGTVTSTTESGLDFAAIGAAYSMLCE